MSLSGTNEYHQKDVDSLVDKYKKDGRFDEVRRQYFAKIVADEKFSKLCSQAEYLVEEILGKNRSSFPSKNVVREKLLNELNARFRKRCETIVLQHTGSDESIMTLWSDVHPRVAAFLNLPTDETDDVQHMQENHQVCDMDIDSESEQCTSSGIEPTQHHHHQQKLSDIQLPPSSRLAPPPSFNRSPTSPNNGGGGNSSSSQQHPMVSSVSCPSFLRAKALHEHMKHLSQL